jgi:hypothetical protein
MPNIVGFIKVRQTLKARRAEAKDVSVIVGYSQSYAISVHENLGASHKVGKAKFLEDPARENADLISDTVKKGIETTGSMEAGLMLGGLLLQRLSQGQVPVDTGALKNSAFTRVE